MKMKLMLCDVLNDQYQNLFFFFFLTGTNPKIKCQYITSIKWDNRALSIFFRKYGLSFINVNLIRWNRAKVFLNKLMSNITSDYWANCFFINFYLNNIILLFIINNFNIINYKFVMMLKKWTFVFCEIIFISIFILSFIFYLRLSMEIDSYKS